MRKFIRVLLSVCLLGHPLAGDVFAYGNDYNSPIQLTQFQPNLPQYNQFKPYDVLQIKPQWFSQESYFKPSLDLNLFTARVPQFEVSDFGNQAWMFTKDTIKFDEGKLSVFSAQVTTPQNTRLQYDFSKAQYQDKIKTPSSYTQSFQDEKGTTFQRDRFNQNSISNESHKTYQQYIQRQYPELISNPYAERPKGLYPEPPVELVQGFQETWTVKSPQGKTTKADVRIENMQYESGRYLSQYNGSVKTGNDTLKFNVNMPRDSKGGIESVKVEVWADNAPKATLSWNKVEGVNADESFQTFQNSVPVPLLAGPRSTLASTVLI